MKVEYKGYEITINQFTGRCSSNGHSARSLGEMKRILDGLLVEQSNAEKTNEE
jgi:hypothetical protein